MADVRRVTRMLPAPGRRARGTIAVVAALACLATPAFGAAAALADGPARTDPAAQARTLRAKVEALQPKVDAALADYDTALGGVGQAVGRGVAAEQTYERLSELAVQAADRHVDRVTSLYKAGGDTTLRVTAMTGTDPLAALSRYRYLAGVVRGEAAAAERSRSTALVARQARDDANASLSASIDTAAEVSRQLDQLRALLDEQQALLDDADARVRQEAAYQAASAAVAGNNAAAAAAGAAAARNAKPEPIPAAFRALYVAAAKTCPGLPWAVLGAIGQVESHHNANARTSSAGAIGPMQFLPSTFAAYAVDGDHDGRTDIHNPADAIFTAARYLCHNGGGHGPAGQRNAVWNYNHADWYVDMVMALAAEIH